MVSFNLAIWFYPPAFQLCYACFIVFVYRETSSKSTASTTTIFSCHAYRLALWNKTQRRCLRFPGPGYQVQLVLISTAPHRPRLYKHDRVYRQASDSIQHDFIMTRCIEKF